MDKARVQEVFSDKAYVESIAKLSPEEAAKSLNEKGVEVTAEDLIQLRDFLMAHKEEIANGELSEEALTQVAGGMSSSTAIILGVGGVQLVSIGIAVAALLSLW